MTCFFMQQGSLCALHCLNSLLQGQYFNPVDLAEIARKLDDQEREQMAEGGINSQEYMHFLEQPSSNMDDRGFFSIQVITKALGVWSLDIIPYNSQHPTAIDARKNPVLQSAYICNMREHWFTIRKIGYQWFNLNSLLSGPELISDTYLALFLTQLQQEGYSIFIIVGSLPHCEADTLLKLSPAIQTVKPTIETPLSANSSLEDQMDTSLQHVIETTREYAERDDPSLQKALEMSLRDNQKQEEAQLETALQLSMQEDDLNSTSNTVETPSSASVPSTSHKSPDPPLSVDELRQKRLLYLSRTNSIQNNGESSEACSSSINNAVQPKENSDKNDELSEEEMLKKAIAMSMEAASM